MSSDFGNNDQKKQKNGSPFPVSVFPEEVFPLRIFPWMGNDTDQDDDGRKDDDSADQGDENAD